MKKIITLFSVLSLIVLFSCTKVTGVDVTEHFNASTYYFKLDISDGMNVTVTDKVDDIVITADEGVMQKIKVITTNGTLQIHRTDVGIVYITKAEVLLPYNPDLKQVTVGYDSKFYTPFGLEGDRVKVKVNERSEFVGYLGANELVLDIDNDSKIDITFDAYDNMDLKINSSSHAWLDGHTPTVHLEMNDNSTIEKQWNDEYYAFQCYDCYGTMYSNCTAHIDCDRNLSVKATINSYLYYTSRPNLSGSTTDETSEFIYSGGYK